MAFPGTFTDQMGRVVRLPAVPQRIISLCPSQTETLVDLGIGGRLVGRTRFCIHPREFMKQVKSVGGTKEVDLQRIRALQPDLIIGEKEENTPEMIAELEKEWPVFMTDVRDLEGARQMVLDLGRLVDSNEQAAEMVLRIDASMEAIRPMDKVIAGEAPIVAEAPVPCLYLIWKNPWMAAGTDTFIDSVLKKCGFDNVASQLVGRYPVLDEKVFCQQKPRIIFLSTEPYPFKAGHIAEIQAIMPDVLVKIVDGEMFSWYGSHMIGVENYLNVLLQEITRWLSLQN